MELARPVKNTGFKIVFGALGGYFFLIIVVLLLMISIVSSINYDTGYDTTGRANINAECEAYRYLVEQYAELHGIPDFVEILMCIMMQESGGRYLDVMQSSECPYNTRYPHGRNTITDPEYSIDCGVQAFRDALESAGCTSPEQMDLLKLALQGYNFGSGYVSWAIANYGGYSKSNAVVFSNMMAAKMGWSRYGDVDYVEHVLQYYNTVGSYNTDGIANEEALNVLETLQESWSSDMDSRRGAVISKGASLIGKVSYDMFGEDTRSGVDNPRTLDCSSFVAWAFHKSGFTDVPYSSTTGTFVSSSNFVQIQVSELIPGDIGLINMIASGGSNHVGIYAGRDSNGTTMWLHCTSHASSGCATVVTGPRISYYSAFQIFYRYTGFRD